ncbi:MAG TPA: helicase-related protein [Candidatus Nanoarchaeia archaeon]|nr:helicase-related protein [Candidatus Nanoarchaeia archaeon]
MDPILKLALQTLEQNKQAIIFAPSRSSAEKTAEEIAKLTSFQLPELEQEVLKAASTPTKQCRKLSHTIKKGVAFHHAGLLQKQKELVEDEFRTGKIKIICATPTLAAGLSLPVFRVIIRSLKRYSERWGMDWIPVLEYLQMAGRAGRPEYEAYGEAVCIAKDEAEKEEIHERYILGKPEAIYSKLAVEPVLRTYLLSLISSGIIRDRTSMKEFFTKTFWAYQFKDMQKLESIMERMLHLLEEWGFITIVGAANAGFITANELNQEKLRPTPLGKRVSELYLDPLTARHLLDCVARFDQNKNAFSLLQMVSHTLEMRPLLRVKSKEEDTVQEELSKRYDFLLKEEPSAYDLEYDDFVNSIKTALFFEAWIDEKDEDFLLEKYDIRPGEIRIKQETADWLLYGSEELAVLQDHKTAVKEIRKLRLRVQEGVREELLPLLKLQGIGRVRARKLHAQGIKDLGDVKKIDLTSLTQLLGKAIAESLKKQVGEEVKEVPEGTRKGQTSILKY